MIGKRLADERKRLGLSQQSVADSLGISRSSVAMIETDRAPLEANRLVLLSEFGFDYVYLLTGQPARLVAGDMLDWELLSTVLSEIQAWSVETEIQLSPQKTIVIARLLYKLCAESGTVSTQAVRDMLSVAA